MRQILIFLKRLQLFYCVCSCVKFKNSFYIFFRLLNHFVWWKGLHCVEEVFKLNVHRNNYNETCLNDIHTNIIHPPIKIYDQS